MNVDALVRRAANGLAILGGVCVLLMMTQIVLDVALSYLFNIPIPGNLQIVSAYYMVGVVFLPLALVELRREHIAADFFVQMLPKRMQSYIYAGGCLVSAAFFGILAYQTLLDAIGATRSGEMMMGNIYVTIWPARWALPVGFFVILLAVLIHGWRAVRDPEGFNPDPESPQVPQDDRG